MKLIKHAFKLFCTQFPQWNNAVKHLMLSFDVVNCSDKKLYVNEVSVLPLAYLFLDNYFGMKNYLMKATDTMATYIKKHWGCCPT
jgi:hypothetical protein